MIPKNQFLSEEERVDKFAAFLEENVLPALKKNEEKLDELYKAALQINQKTDDTYTLKDLSDSILSGTKIGIFTPEKHLKLEILKAYNIIKVPRMAFGNQFIAGKTPKMIDKPKIDLLRA